jgi:hypothetical protein
MTGPRLSPVIRWRRDERRTPEKAVIDVHASRGSDWAAALLVPGRELSTRSGHPIAEIHGREADIALGNRNRLTGAALE